MADRGADAEATSKVGLGVEVDALALLLMGSTALWWMLMEEFGPVAKAEPPPSQKPLTEPRLCCPCCSGRSMKANWLVAVG